jgi:uncharacterized protein (DUF305 family)
MTEDADDSTVTYPPGPPARPTLLSRWGGRGTAVVLGIGALVMVLLGATIGLALAHTGPQTVAISADGQDPVNTGFARDMVVHHNQGVRMAHAGELDSTDPEIRRLAYDIEFQQTSQIGTMQGWLDLWDVPRITEDAHMAWMGSVGMGDMQMSPTTTAGATGVLSDGAVMPGMATDAEVAKLESLKGAASDVYFLQLMIRHHQGGAVMMTYAANHAASKVVQNFASKMEAAQTSEISIMTQMLAQRGAKPLPYTAPTG